MELVWWETGKQLVVELEIVMTRQESQTKWHAPNAAKDEKEDTAEWQETDSTHPVQEDWYVRIEPRPCVLRLFCCKQAEEHQLLPHQLKVRRRKHTRFLIVDGHIFY